jgi:7-carboxy-7-deazaguanine synthase
MKIAEIFYSIQGEGPHIGCPAVFLRTAGCNLKCSWCDSKFAWEKKYENNWRELSSSELSEEISSYPSKHLVVTGGEPLLYQQELSQTIQDYFPEYFVEVETNGTLTPNGQLGMSVNQWIVSPKLSNSKEGNIKDATNTIKIEEFKKFNVKYKFVIATSEDVDEVDSFIKEHGLKNQDVILMPEATTPEKLQQISRWLVEECKKRNYRFSTRLQITLWGDKRGV